MGNETPKFKQTLNFIIMKSKNIFGSILLFIAFVLYNSVAISQITSIQTGSWDAPSTWSCACVPSQNSTVVVSAGHTVTLASNNSKARFLTIDGTLRFPSSPAVYLLIYRNLTISNTGNIIGSPYFRILKTGTQKSSITNNSTNTISLIDLRVENDLGVDITSGNFMITRQLAVYNACSLSVFSGVNITLQSTASSTSRIDPIDGSITGGGRFIAKRFISNRPAGWADLASPITNTSFSDWDSELYMSGVGGIDGNSQACPTCPIFYSVYTFNNASQSYVTITDTSTSIPHGLGVELWLASDQNNFNAGFFDSRGSVYSGNLTFSSGGGQLASNTSDYNFLGNPYHAWLRWNNVTKSNLSNDVWIYDAESLSYLLYSGTVNIPPSQGFWVENSGNNPSLTFTEASKYIFASSTFYRMDNLDDSPLPFVENENELIEAENEYLAHEAELAIYAPTSGLKNQTYFRSLYTASNLYDQNDASLLPALNKNITEIYSVLPNGKKLGLNAINASSDKVEIPVYIKSKLTQSYLLKINNLPILQKDFPYIYLLDKKTGEMHEVYENRDITSCMLESDKVHEFSLIMSKEEYGKQTSFIHKPQVYFSESNTVRILVGASFNQMQVNVYNVMGQQLVLPMQVGNTSSQFEISVPATNGVLLVEMIIDGQRFVQKLVH